LKYYPIIFCHDLPPNQVSMYQLWHRNHWHETLNITLSSHVTEIIGHGVNPESELRTFI